jgi:hypothetical protein
MNTMKTVDSMMARQAKKIIDHPLNATKEPADASLIQWAPSTHPVNSALLDYIDAVVRHACGARNWPAGQAEVAAQLRNELQERFASMAPYRPTED